MQENDILIYQPTAKEQKAIDWVNENFPLMWENNQQKYEQFGGKTLLQYIDAGRKAMNIMNKPRDDGRSNVKSASPLNKLKAILARVALKRPDIAVDATNKINNLDILRGQVLKDAYVWSYENIDEENTADTEYFFKAFDCNIDGVKITYEGYDGQTHTQRKIIDYDINTGEVESEEEEYKTDRCFSQDIRPEDFYVWNPFMRSLQNQPKVAWRTVYTKTKFDYEFDGFKRAKYVKTVSQAKSIEPESIYAKENTRITNDQVEVIRLFDRFNDRMVIMANNVILQDSPMVWNNGTPKKYPFAKTIASPFAGGEFFWGMHLWHAIEGDVSALETLYNLGIEQQKIAVNPPTLNASGSEIEDGMLLAGRVIEVDDVNNFRELNFKSPDQSYFNFVELIAKNIDFATTDPVSAGQNVQGATARGQVIAEENARKLLSLFNIMMENLVLQEAKLRIANIIQFQIVPGMEFRVKNTTVDGQAGVREVKVIGDMVEAEPQSMLDMIEASAELMGINLQRINITTEYLKNIKYSIKVISDSSYQQGKSMMSALETEKQATIAKLFPNIFQSASEIFFKEFMKKHDDDPQKYLDAAQQSVNAAGAQMMAKENPMGQATQDMAGGNQELGLAKLNGVE